MIDPSHEFDEVGVCIFCACCNDEACCPEVLKQCDRSWANLAEIAIQVIDDRLRRV